MEKTHLFLSSNDWHIKDDNTQQIIKLIKGKVEVAKELGIRRLVCLGDIFDSRLAQRLNVLKCFEDILNIISQSGMYMTTIPGNHDKTDYNSYSSFLDPFRGHPGLDLYDKATTIPLSDKIDLHLLPFFEEGLYLKELSKLKCNVQHTNILLTHSSFEGSVNNDGSMVSSSIKPTLFKKFDIVLAGHYHNAQQIGDNIVHLPSIRQKDYGEDDSKGYTLFSDNLEMELIQSDFKKYRKVVIDLEKLTEVQVKTIIEKNKNSNDNIRLEIRGSEAMVKAQNKNHLTELGFDVKLKVTELETVQQANSIDDKLTASELDSEFKSFCEKEGLDYEFGKSYLTI
jgi:exonuclease SbcD